jgi:hypothetical protein
VVKEKDFILGSVTSSLNELFNSALTEIVLDTIVGDIVVISVTEGGGRLYMVVTGGRWW